jgi:shikimate dehydrogenase
MRKFGLIGFPLGHSFSKKYFTEKFAASGLEDCSYENFPLTKISLLPGIIKADPELVGLNVTIPYKSEVIHYLDRIDAEALNIGAVNVLKIKRIHGQPRLKGFNSDVAGFRDSVLPYINAKVKNAIVLGTGGSSKAVVYSLKKLGLHVGLVSRNPGAGLLGYQDINAELLDNTQLIVNTTPLGMFPDVDSRPLLNYDLLNHNHILYDLVYNPELTSFLKAGKERGAIVISGIKMLHAQAEKAWEIWNDINL